MFSEVCYIPAYQFKVNNKNIRKRCKINLTIKTPG